MSAVDAEVWAAALEQVRPNWVGYLDPAERQRFDRYRRPADRDRFLLGTCLVRAVAGLRLGVAPARVALDRTCPRCHAPHGRVRVVGGDLSVSISHSGDWVLVAECRGGEVGVDVERVDPAFDPLEVAAVALSPEETDTVRAVEPDRRGVAFARYWTRKEAVLKAAGDGLASAPSQLHVSGPDEPASLRAWPARPDLVERVRLTDLDVVDGYVACLALVAPAGPTPAGRPLATVRPAAEILPRLSPW